jgi:hypothetical protein
MRTMAPSIRVDDEVYAHLKGLAEPFVDTPNTVLRRVFSLDKGRDAPIPRSFKDRLAPGSLLHTREYRLPILRALADRGGAAPAHEIIEAVGEALKTRLTDTDRSVNRTGGIRWINRTMWVRSHLVNDGLLAKGSPKGTWELTEAGREYLREADA